jgi:tetratricopeptide (TPR) repeat protein
MKTILMCIAFITFSIQIFSQDTDNFIDREIIEESFQANYSISDYNKLLEKEPMSARTLIDRGYAFDRVMNHQFAIMDYSRAIEIAPDFATAFFYRANTKYKLTDYRGAILDYTKALELFIKIEENKPNAQIQKVPNWADREIINSLNNRGNAKCHLSDYEGALEDFNQVIDKDKKSAYAYYFRGIAKILLDFKEGGCLDLSTSGELGDRRAYTAIRSLCR